MPRKGFQALPFKGSRLAFATECIQRGWNIVPIPHGHKHAAGTFDVVDDDGVVSQKRWGYFQDNPITEEQAPMYWSDDPAKIDGNGVALITGSRIVNGEECGVMVLDADKKPAVEYLQKHGLESPLAASTRTSQPIVNRVCPSLDGDGNHKPEEPWRRHHWFAYDPTVKKDIGKTIEGLDVLTNGALVMMYPSPDYYFETAFESGFDLDNLPTFKGFPRAEPEGDFDPNNADLRNTVAAAEAQGFDVFLKGVQELAARDGGKMGVGSRNDTLAAFIGHALSMGFIGDDLRRNVNGFMDKYFAERLEKHEVDLAINSITSIDREAHPGRAEERAAERIKMQSVEKRKFVTYKMRDMDRMHSEAKSVTYLMEPWIRSGAIIQVFGYSGHGKSLFVQHGVSAMTAGKNKFGPFKINRKADGSIPNVLYLDWENGKAMISDRFKNMEIQYGDTGDHLNVWTPDGESDAGLSLSDEVDRLFLDAEIEKQGTDIVIIDTVRSAFSGLEENKAEGWKYVNEFALRQSRLGRTVIMLHHANKPQGDDLGHFAGSGNQITYLMRQVGLTQVFRDADEAKRMAGIPQSKFEKHFNLWDVMEGMLPDGHRLKLIQKIVYHKARDVTEAEDSIQFIGFAQHKNRRKGIADVVVSTTSIRQRATELAMQGLSQQEIEDILWKGDSVIEEWLGI